VIRAAGNIISRQLSSLPVSSRAGADLGLKTRKKKQSYMRRKKKKDGMTSGHELGKATSKEYLSEGDVVFAGIE
jgi:hypothetical protein